jgi:hypothetical protein
LLLKPGKHIKWQLTLFRGDRETVNKSYGYSGKGVATYPNGDIYEGHFVNGVRII